MQTCGLHHNQGNCDYYPACRTATYPCYGSSPVTLHLLHRGRPVNPVTALRFGTSPLDLLRLRRLGRLFDSLLPSGGLL